jgi:K+-transporting ATPase ATPase A chain
MTSFAWLQLGGYLALLVGLGVPLGHYMARVYTGEAKLAQRALAPVERLLYRLLGIDPGREMGWREYTLAVLAISAVSLVAVYAIQRLQGVLPGNPAGFAGVPAALAFNTAMSFVTNTNWQAYGGETTMSNLTQMLALTVQNFVSAAVGMAVLAAFIRGLHRRTATTLGNAWVDVTRSVLYVLLPLAVVLSLLLVSQGVVQTMVASREVTLVQPFQADSSLVTTQTIAVGPAASQVAIKQLGTNGGGFFNVNAAHPLENPTPFSNLLEMLAILLIPVALCFTFGRMVKDDRQGWAIFAAMAIIFTVLTVATTSAEQAGNPVLTAVGADQAPSGVQPGGNMEGKEARFGPVSSALWATATTSASNGSVNSMHDSFTPLGGLWPLWLMQLGEVVFGGVGSGLYGMLIFVILAVFIAGLMVGRTPEYLGKKIEAREVTLSAVIVLLPSALLLIGTAVALVLPSATASIFNPGAHGFTEVLYGFTSASNNNGSAFAGLNANTPFFNLALGIAMFVSRFWIIVPTLAIAGSLAGKKSVPPGLGTLPTHTPLFVALLLGTVLLVGALAHLPGLALGPIVEHLMLMGH